MKTTPKSFISIPDSAFEEFLLKHFDTDHDGKISAEEAAAITEIDLRRHHASILASIDETGEAYFPTEFPDPHEIRSLKGIEQMPNLEKLWLNNFSLEELDLSHNPKLTHLQCDNCRLDRLEGLPAALEELVCYDNNLTDLELGESTALRRLYCDSNRLSALDLRQNTALRISFSMWTKGSKSERKINPQKKDRGRDASAVFSIIKEINTRPYRFSRSMHGIPPAPRDA